MMRERYSTCAYSNSALHDKNETIVKKNILHIYSKGIQTIPCKTDSHFFLQRNLCFQLFYFLSCKCKLCQHVVCVLLSNGTVYMQNILSYFWFNFGKLHVILSLLPFICWRNHRNVLEFYKSLSKEETGKSNQNWFIYCMLCNCCKPAADLKNLSLITGHTVKC